MKQYVFAFLALTVIVGVLAVLRAGGGGGEDTWTCVNNEWVRHGNPAGSAPGTGCGVAVSPALAPAVKEEVTSQIANKYGKPAEMVEITVNEDSGKFAKGMVSFKGEMGGALWFAAYTEKGWELVHDGQGPMDCVLADKYQMPLSMVPGCVDTENGNEFVERK